MPESPPQSAQLWSQAQCHLAAKQAAPARAALEALLVVDPDHTLGRLALCNLAWRQNRVREAAEHALHAARSVPEYPELICETAGVLLRVGEAVAARECLQRSALKRVASDTLLIRLADHWHALGRHAEALAQTDRARQLGFDGDGIRHRRGRALAALGRTREAEPDLELGFLLGPTHGEIALELAGLRTQTRERNHFNTLANGIKSVTRGSREHAALEFALYKELEDVGRFDDAWAALTRANAVMAQRKRCNVESMRRWFSLCIALWTRETLRPAPADIEGPRPIFVIGLPHSGTRELAERLARHSDVANAGELRSFEQQLCWMADHRGTQDEAFLERLPTIDFGELGRRYLAQTQWRAQGRPYYVDSQPDNWMYAGLIHAALPDAAILHARRDSMDARFACYRTFFGDSQAWSYDQATVGDCHSGYRNMIAHWHAEMPEGIVDIPHAEMPAAADVALRRLFGSSGISQTVGHARPQGDGPMLEGGHLQEAGAWRPYARHLRWSPE